MPTSRPNHLADLALTVVAENPVDILDIGCGFGGKGVLFRECTDIWHQRYSKPDWKTRIDAIEPHVGYLTPLHHYIYSTVYGMTFMEWYYNVATGPSRDSKGVFTYDFIYMGDVLEHMPMADGYDTLEALGALCDKTIYVSTPVVMHPQGAVLGNPLETHVCQWNEAMFLSVPMAKSGTWSFQVFGNILVAKWRVT